MWRAGAHFLISPDDWPHLLPAVVLGAVRRAPLVNGDPFMSDLRAMAMTLPLSRALSASLRLCALRTTTRMPRVGRVVVQGGDDVEPVQVGHE